MAKEVHGKEGESHLLNNAKQYVEREADVCALTVVTDDHKFDQNNLVLHVEDCKSLRTVIYRKFWVNIRIY